MTKKQKRKKKSPSTTKRKKRGAYFPFDRNEAIQNLPKSPEKVVRRRAEKKMEEKGVEKGVSREDPSSWTVKIKTTSMKKCRWKGRCTSRKEECWTFC